MTPGSPLLPSRQPETLASTFLFRLIPCLHVLALRLLNPAFLRSPHPVSLSLHTEHHVAECPAPEASLASCSGCQSCSVHVGVPLAGLGSRFRPWPCVLSCCVLWHRALCIAGVLCL